MRARAAAAAASAALALAAAAPAGAGAAVVLEDGHVDVGARIADGALRLQVKDGTGGAGVVAWREPDDVVLHARPAAATTVPAGAATAFLGPPGTPLWLLPQVQRPGLLWPGWNTESLTAADVAGTVRWTLTAVEGPGSFALFTTGAFGSVDKLFDTSDGLPDAREIALGTHAHGNWAFGAEGRYRLSFAISARRPSGELSTDARTVTVTVGTVDPATGAPLGGGGGGGGGAPDPGGGGGPGGGPGGSGSGPGGPGGSGQPGGADPGAEPGGAGRPGRRRALRLRMTGRARLRGRMLAVPLRVSARSTVRVTLRRGRRVVARGPARVVGSGARVLRVRLDRRLARSARGVRVVAHARAAGIGSATATVALRAGRR